MHDRLQDAEQALAAALDDVYTVCVAAQRLAPSQGEDLPGGCGGALLDAHRVLARSATLAAQAGETVTFAVAALRAEQLQEASRLAGAATRTVDQVAGHVARAEELVRRVEHG